VIKVEETKQSIWNRNLNLAFVYISILLIGLSIVSVMINVINRKVEELNAGYLLEDRNYRG